MKLPLTTGIVSSCLVFTVTLSKSSNWPNRIICDSRFAIDFRFIYPSNQYENTRLTISQAPDEFHRIFWATHNKLHSMFIIISFGFSAIIMAHTIFYFLPNYKIMHVIQNKYVRPRQFLGIYVCTFWHSFNRENHFILSISIQNTIITIFCFCCCKRSFRFQSWSLFLG